MQFRFVLKSILIAIIALFLVVACGGGSSDAPLRLTVTGPSELYSWQTLEVEVSSNKSDTTYLCQWSLDGVSWTISPQNTCSLSLAYFLRDVKQNTTVMLEVFAESKDEQASVEKSFSVIYQYHLGDAQREVAENVLIAKNQTVNLADTVFKLAPVGLKSTNDLVLDCEFEDNYTMVFADNDNNEIVSIGDSMRFEFEDCFLRAMEARLNGALIITIDGFNSFAGPDKLSVVADGLEIELDGDELVAVANGTFTATQEIELDASFTEFSTELFTFEIVEHTTLNLKRWQTYKTLNFDTAELELRLSGFIQESETGAEYGVGTDEDLTADVGFFPTRGSLDVVSQQNNQDRFKITAIDAPNYDDNFIVDGSSIAFDARDYNGYGTYRPSSLMYMSYKRPHEDEFRILGVQQTYADFEVADQITVMFNKPISSISESPRLSEDEMFGHVTSASLDIKGLNVTLTPAELLQAGSFYSIYFSDVISTEEFEEGGMSVNFRVSDDIIPVITPSQHYFTSNSAPELTSLQSELNSGREYDYQWQVIEPVDVTFESPNGISTSTVIEQNVEQDFTVRLSMSNEFGDRAMVDSKFLYLDTSDDYLLLIGEEDTYITDSKTWVLNKADTEVSHGAVAGMGKSKTNIALEFYKDTHWDIDLFTTDGSDLKVGTYHYDYAADSGETSLVNMNFSGNHRACGEYNSYFDIHEIVYDANNNLTSLALDFEYICGWDPEGRPSIFGKVRINSSVALEQE